MIARRREPAVVALAVLGAGSPILLTCLLVPATWAPWAGWGLIVLTAGFPLALVALAAGRKAAFRRLGPALAITFTLLAGSLGAIRALAGGGARVAGIPAGLAVMLGGLGLAAFAATTALYVLAYPAFGPREDDLARLRRLAERRGAADPPKTSADVRAEG